MISRVGGVPPYNPEPRSRRVAARLRAPEDPPEVPPLQEPEIVRSVPVGNETGYERKWIYAADMLPDVPSSQSVPLIVITDHGVHFAAYLGNGKWAKQNYEGAFVIGASGERSYLNPVIWWSHRPKR